MRRTLRDRTAGALLSGSILLVCSLLAAVLGVVLSRGLPHLTWKFLTSEGSILRGTTGILPAILNTLVVTVLSLSTALPLGVGAAVYLTEYAHSSVLVSLIEFAADTLAALPSILYALAGSILFCTKLGMGKTLLSASLTLAIMVLPMVIRTTRESLKAVPALSREGALGLGAGKWHMIRTVVLPGSRGGILTGCILSIGRVVGESAVLLYTAGLSTTMQDLSPRGILRSGGATLSTALYVHAKERADPDAAFAIAAVLLLLTIVLNLLAGLALGRQRR